MRGESPSVLRALSEPPGHNFLALQPLAVQPLQAAVTPLHQVPQKLKLVNLRRGAPLHWCVCAIVALGVLPVRAQQTPDAGSLLRDQPRPPAAPAPQNPPPTLQPPALDTSPAGPTMLVRAFRVEGSTLFTEAQLLPELEPLVGRELGIGQLQRAALLLVGYYARQGYLARVALPPQEVKDGVVRYLVEEGVRGRLTLDRRGTRVEPERVAGFIDARLARGALMDMGALGEALNILNDQPGVQVSSSMAPGLREREIDLQVVVEDKPLTRVDLSLNNQGARSTGTVQASAVATLANAGGRFDAWSALVNVSEGTRFARAEYSQALGMRGMRLGVNVSWLDYELLSAFSALRANGTARTLGLAATYPLARRTGFVLGLAGSVDHKRLADRTLAGETSNRTVQAASLGLGGETTQNEGPLRGVTAFGLNLTLGESDQHNAAAAAADRAGRQVQGSFAKLAWTASLQRPLDAFWTLQLKARGQIADRNLDSSEGLSLGGPAGVRGYPAAEGGGDAGWIASLSLTRPLGIGGWTAGGFLDTGHVTVNRQPPAGAQATPNRYRLSAGGLSLGWREGERWDLNLIVAAPLGRNPAAPAGGANADGSAREARAWLTLAAQF